MSVVCSATQFNSAMALSKFSWFASSVHANVAATPLPVIASKRQVKVSLQSKIEFESKAAREHAYRTKKEMEARAAKERQAEEAREADLRKKGAEERKKNDEYDAWLAKDHIRTAQERGHERADASKMHEGGKFSGIPTDFTPGK